MTDHNVFHEGELYLQKLSGVDVLADKLSKRLIIDYLPEQHQAFYPLLNTLFIASIDEAGKPWASIIAGEQGFVNAQDQKHLVISAEPIKGDKLIDNITKNQYLGILGLEYRTRRRNRIAGKIVQHDSKGLTIEVEQALGNCPKYIQARNATFLTGVKDTPNEGVKICERMNDECQHLIKQADTFFIASHHANEEKQGADVSHRGGKPGFVRIVSDEVLMFDDFSGNNLYMTLGNLHSYPHAGLLFINYSNGDLWQLQCQTEIIETPGEKYSRQIKLKISEVRKIPSGLNVKWEFIDYSRFL